MVIELKTGGEYMKKMMVTVFGFMFLLSAGLAYAIPTLQLDIAGGTYDPVTETIIAPSKTFDLYAYLIPDNKVNTSTQFFISFAVVPQANSSANLGSFTFAGFLPIPVTSPPMMYGTPESLPGHGIFPTLYIESPPFTFGSASQIAPYNTADRAISGDPIPTSGSGMYSFSFPVDVTGLSEGYNIHFDLYGYYTGASGKTQIEFAPFSHDAQSNGNKVPEPATLLFLGAGLFGLGGLRRRFIK